jgi:hypothetical protein
MRARFAITALAITFFSIAVVAKENTSTGENVCRLSAPPKEAKETVLHAFTTREFPQSVPSNYTGCKRIWLEDNSVLSTVYFKAGQIISAEVSEPKGKRYTCHYRAGALLQDRSAKDCPDDAKEWR